MKWVKKTKIGLICQVCETIFLTHKQRALTCSKKCSNLKLKDLNRYGGHRKEILERDKYRCVKCNMTQQEHFDKWGKSLTIDHKDGNGFYTPKNEKNNEVSNLQTLCLSCHNYKDKAYLNLKYMTV